MTRNNDLKRGLGLVISGKPDVTGSQEIQPTPIRSKELAKVEITEEPTASGIGAAEEHDGRLNYSPTPHKERIQPFNLQIPESLHVRLKNYVENHGRRHESMTRIILEGLEMTLDQREEKAGVRKS
jgi:hypothetical protein